MRSQGLPGTARVAPTTGGCTWCTRSSTPTRATTWTSTSASPMMTVLPGAARCESTTTTRRTASSCRRSRSQDRAVADSWPGRALERPHSRARPGDAMGRVPAGLVAITGVKRVLAQRNVLTRDVLLVSAKTVVVTDYAGVGGRPLRPVDPAVFEGYLLRRVVSRGQTGDKRCDVPGLGVHGQDARAIVLRPNGPNGLV